MIRELGRAGLLHKNALTVSGDSIWNNVKAARNWNPKVIFPIEKPFKKQGGIAVLRGNLVPKGAVIKPSAATPKLMKHRGYVKLYIDHVNQADEGADLDILVGGSGTPLLRESH